MAQVKLADTRIERQVPLQSAEQIAIDIAQTPKEKKTVQKGRKIIENIFDGSDKRTFIVVGPCSIHDINSAKEYAKKLRSLAEEVEDKLILVMRCYFEKPRTTVGWKGLRNDPELDGSYDINAGLRLSREILKYVTGLGVYTGTEYLSTVTPQYLGDFISWAAIGARTVESQEHRSLASGLSVPVGFKNGTGGLVDVAINAVLAARSGHTFEGATTYNSVAIFKTSGNPYAHVILRGGKKPNYDKKSIKDTQQKLQDQKLSPSVVIDCSHANSNKDYKKQHIAFKDVISQIKAGNKGIKGLMLESNLEDGNQKIGPKDSLKYGVSVTDSCIGWQETEDLIHWAYKTL